MILSDPHGCISIYQKFKDSCKNLLVDVGIIAGDLTTYSEFPCEDEAKIKSILNTIGIPVLFIMGNDDRFAWEDSKTSFNINQRKVRVKNNFFVGYQYTNPFIGGIFEKTEDEQIVDLQNLKRICEEDYILITHGPAYGILDKVSTGENVGSKALLDFIKHTRPQFHIFGHIHEDYGIFNNSLNASYPISKKMYLLNFEEGKIKEI